MRHFLLLMLLALVPTACASQKASKSPDDRGQPFAVALEMICQVDERAGISADDDELTTEEKRSDWLDAHIQNPDAIYYRTLLRVSTPTEQADSLAARAKKHELQECALARTLRRSGSNDAAAAPE